MMYKFSDKELKKLLQNLVVIVDSRENANLHVTSFFDKKNINYTVDKVDYGDYGAFIQCNQETRLLGVMRDWHFQNDIVVERKFCIDELAMNLKDNKTNINEINKEIIELLGEKYLQKVLKCDYNRFKQELTSLNKFDTDFFILLEDPLFDFNLRNKNYRAKYEPVTLNARIKSLESEFRTKIRPIDREYSGSEIYNSLHYGIRNVLKNKGFIDTLPSNV